MHAVENAKVKIRDWKYRHDNSGVCLCVCMSVCLCVCHTRALIKPLDGMRCHLQGYSCGNIVLDSGPGTPPQRKGEISWSEPSVRSDTAYRQTTLTLCLIGH